MTEEQADLLNKLFEIEERIGDLWEFHPDNPNQTNVEERFEELQKLVITIETYLEEQGIDIDEENEVPF